MDECVHKCRRKRRNYLDGPLGCQNRDAQFHLVRLPREKVFEEKRKCQQDLSLMGNRAVQRDHIVQRPGNQKEQAPEKKETVA